MKTPLLIAGLLLSCFVTISCGSINQLLGIKEDKPPKEEPVEKPVLNEDDDSVIMIGSIPHESTHAIYPKGDKDFFEILIKKTTLLQVRLINSDKDKHFMLYDHKENRLYGTVLAKPGKYYVKVLGDSEGAYTLKILIVDPISIPALPFSAQVQSHAWYKFTLDDEHPVKIGLRGESRADYYLYNSEGIIISSVKQYDLGTYIYGTRYILSYLEAGDYYFTMRQEQLDDNVNVNIDKDITVLGKLPYQGSGNIKKPGASSWFMFTVANAISDVKISAYGDKFLTQGYTYGIERDGTTYQFQEFSYANKDENFSESGPILLPGNYFVQIKGQTSFANGSFQMSVAAEAFNIKRISLFPYVSEDFLNLKSGIIFYKFTLKKSRKVEVAVRHKGEVELVIFNLEGPEIMDWEYSNSNSIGTLLASGALLAGDYYLAVEGDAVARQSSQQMIVKLK